MNSRENRISMFFVLATGLPGNSEKNYRMLKLIQGVRNHTIRGGEMLENHNLVLKSKKGDIQSFMVLIEKEQNRLYSIAYTYFGNKYDAEDIISESAIKAFQKVNQLRDSKKFYAWFISILLNECNRKYRRRKREIPMDAQMLETEVDSFVENSDHKIILMDALKKIKVDEKDMVILKYLRGFSFDELAIIYKIPLSTAKSRVTRALKKLKVNMGGGQ